MQGPLGARGEVRAVDPAARLRAGSTRGKFLYETGPLTLLLRKLLPRDPTQARRESKEHGGPVSRHPEHRN